MRKIRVKGLIDDLPEDLTIDITELNIGGSIKMKDLELLDPPNSVILRVKTARVIEEIEEEEDEEGVEGEAAEGTTEGGEAAAGDEAKKEGGEEKKES